MSARVFFASQEWRRQQHDHATKDCNSGSVDGHNSEQPCSPKPARKTEMYLSGHRHVRRTFAKRPPAPETVDQMVSISNRVESKKQSLTPRDQSPKHPKRPTTAPSRRTTRSPRGDMALDHERKDKFIDSPAVIEPSRLLEAMDISNRLSQARRAQVAGAGNSALLSAVRAAARGIGPGTYRRG